MIEIDEGFSGPDLRSKFFAGHQFARAVQQCGEYLYRLALQAELNAMLAQFGGSHIQLKTIKTQETRGWSRYRHTNSAMGN